MIYSGPQEDRKELRLGIMARRISMNVVITTYNCLSSTPEDRGFFKKLQFHYAVFDEAHMLKNMLTQRYKPVSPFYLKSTNLVVALFFQQVCLTYRYQSLMQISSEYKLMLTGTPLQNNLIELMSLLTFTMPNMFESKTDHMKSLFKGYKGSFKFEFLTFLREST